jgi:hypothetical protein
VTKPTNTSTLPDDKVLMMAPVLVDYKLLMGVLVVVVVVVVDGNTVW